MDIKTIFFFLFVILITSAQAQNQLDDIAVKLPKDYTWEEQTIHFENDSSHRKQEWLVKDNNDQFKMNFVIYSMDKSVPNTSLNEVKEGLLKRPRKKHKVTRLEKSELKRGYTLETYKVIAAHKVRDSRGSFLVGFTETNNNVHIIYLRNFSLKLSEDFVNQWNEIIRDLLISPSTTKN